MKKRMSAALAAIVAVGVAFAGQGAPAEAQGNGAPSGRHYNLNIVGGPGNGSGGASGHVIHAPLNGNCRIDLAMGAFKVLDNSCNDGDAAQFQLPDPDPEDDGVTAYSVYARALGKPNGSSRMTSCFQDATGTFCSTENVVLLREKGKSSFSNVSRQLLTICINTDDDPECDERVGLFDDDGADYWWDYENSGLRLAQLRFYPVPTNVGTTP